MESFKHSKKGFSLVELLIVMAIMVALIAVLVPQFTRYVQKAKNAVVEDAANQALSMVRTEFALLHLQFIDDSSEDTKGTITIGGETGHLKMVLSNLQYDAEGNFEGKSASDFDAAFEDLCGVDRGRPTGSTVKYVITVTKDNAISHAIATDINVDMSEVNPENA